MKKNRSSLFLFFLILFTIDLYAEDNITDFDENWAVNFLLNYNMGIFGGVNLSEYRTDKPMDIGFGIRYKNISALAVIAVPIFYSFDIWAFDFSLDAYSDNIYYKAYFKRYPYLFVFDDNNQNMELQIHSSGIMASFVRNKENHSLSSVVKLDKRQNVSSGSLLYGFGIFHSSLYSPTGTINKYNEIRHILYFGPSIGYSYTWIFESGMFFNLALVHFSNFGINLNAAQCLYIPKLEPNIVIGHHNNTWSINLKMMDYADFLLWSKDDIEIMTLVSVTLMFSKRF